MEIIDILKKGFTCSAEMLPPKGVFNSQNTLERAESLKGIIDFASVTSGAGGKRKRCGTISLSFLLKNNHHIESIPHLTCLDANEAEIKEKVADIYNLGIENILVLRGDSPDNEINSGIDEKKQEFEYAKDLVKYIREGEDISNKHKHFCLGVAAYPEGYKKDKDVDKSADFLKIKQDMGADFAITQILFDSEIYSNFIKKAEQKGITIPIIPSVRLVKTRAQCEYLINTFDVSMPFMETLYELNGKFEEQFLFDYMSNLCRELKSKGAPGIHFVILKDTELVKKIIPYVK